MLGIDTSNEEFSEIKSEYQIDEEPFFILFSDSVAAIREEPSKSTIQKVKAFKRI